MLTMIRLLLLVVLVCSSAVVPSASALHRDQAALPVFELSASREHSAAIPGQCKNGTLPSRALSRICVPANGWNGDLIIFAHGYVSPYQPIAIQDPAFGGIPLSV